MLSMRAGTLLLAALLLGSCASVGPPLRIYSLTKGESVELFLEPGVRQAEISVERGRLDVLFRNPYAGLHAAIGEGEHRSVCNRDGVTCVTVTAQQRSIFRLRTR